MERRILTFKTCRKGGNINKKLISQIDQVLSSFTENCLRKQLTGSSTSSCLSPTSVFTCTTPGCWQKQVKSQDVNKQLIHQSNTFDIKDPSLATNLHAQLDELYSPGVHMLKMIWICDKLPAALSPELFGVLDRAVSYHNGELIIVSPENGSDDCSSWLQALGGTVVSPDKGLDSILSCKLVWRGNLVLSCDNDVVMEGLELNQFEDALDTVLQQIGLRNIHSHILTADKENPEQKYFGHNLEVVCEVDPLSVPQSYLTSHHFKLTASNATEDEVISMFMSEGFPNSRVGYLARLRIADKLKKKYEKRTSENWKKHVIEDTMNIDDDVDLEDSGTYLFFLIYSDGLRSEDSDDEFLSVVMLKNPREFTDLDLKLKYTQSINEVDWTQIRKVRDLDIHSEFSMYSFYLYRRNYVASVLQRMIDDKNEMVVTKKPEDLVLGVEAAIDDVLELHFSKHREVFNKLPVVKEQKQKLTSDYSDECSEKRFLRLISKKEEPAAPESIAGSRNEGTISLEAAEILKFFKMSGSPAKDLSLEPLSPRSKCSVYMTDDQYSQLFKENFEKVCCPGQYTGFKYIGEDFKNFEFKKFHNVFYNTGPPAEKFDKDYVRMRDVYVGISKETRTTLDLNKAPDKLKLKKSPAASKVMRRSPRKKSIGGKGGLDLKSRNSVLPRSRRADLSKPVVSSSGVISDKDWVRKIRVAVTVALKAKKLEERNPVFRTSFTTLMKMCRIAVPDHTVANAEDMLYKVAMSNAMNIIKSEYQKLKAKR